MQKKSSSKRSGAVRDISTRKQKEEETFKVHHIRQPGADEVLTAIPLTQAQAAQDELINDMEVPNEEVSGDFYENDEILKNNSQNNSKRDGFSHFQANTPPTELVKVKFAKFVQLVTARDCSAVIQAHEDTDIVMSSNLLTELAGAHDEHEERKIPLVFLVGLAIGVVLTYILITK